MQAFLLVIDDIQDRSLLRRGQPCWYRYNDLGLAAINDSLLLESAIFYLIKKYFKGKDCYVNLLETFHDVSKDIFSFSKYIHIYILNNFLLLLN